MAHNTFRLCLGSVCCIYIRIRRVYYFINSHRCHISLTLVYRFSQMNITFINKHLVILMPIAFNILSPILNIQYHFQYSQIVDNAIFVSCLGSETFFSVSFYITGFFIQISFKHSLKFFRYCQLTDIRDINRMRKSC